MKTLSKTELELLRHALYLHREMIRAQERVALQPKGDEKEAARLGQIIRHSLRLDDKLSEIMEEITHRRM